MISYLLCGPMCFVSYLAAATEKLQGINFVDAIFNGLIVKHSMHENHILFTFESFIVP